MVGLIGSRVRNRICIFFSRELVTTSNRCVSWDRFGNSPHHSENCVEVFCCVSKRGQVAQYRILILKFVLSLKWMVY